MHILGLGWKGEREAEQTVRTARAEKGGIYTLGGTAKSNEGGAMKAEEVCFAYLVLSCFTSTKLDDRSFLLL